jgi:hypothetical protein
LDAFPFTWHRQASLLSKYAADTLGRCYGEINSHTIDGMISRHVDGGLNIAMAKSPVPSVDVRRSGGMRVTRVGVFLLERCQLEIRYNGHVDGKNVEIAR